MYECTTLDEDAREIQVSFRLWDTPGPFEWNRLEVLKYPHASVIVVAYAIDWPASFDLVEEKVRRSPSIHLPLDKRPIANRENGESSGYRSLIIVLLACR